MTERNWLYALGDNLIGYDDGTTTPGERLGGGVNALALALYNDPGGTVANALLGAKGDLDDLMFRGGAERRPGDVFNYAAGVGAPQAALRTLPDNALGIFAGRNAKTADTAALETAQDMAARGASRDDIWRDTGWFQGVDGEWRFEIDDSGSLYDPANLEQTAIQGQRFGQAPMPTVVAHDGLYEAYPDLRDAEIVDYPFRGESKGEYRRGWKPEWGGGYNESITVWDGPGDNHSTILHEAQHAIQDRERFGSGGNVQMMAADPNLPENPRHARWSANQDEVLWANEFYNSPAYARERDAINDYWNQVWEPRLQDMSDPEWDTLFDRAAQDVEAKFPTMARFDRAAKEFGLNEPSRHIEPREAYRRLAGEVEARNVQTRRDFTPEQRRATLPWKTQDVPDEQQIVRRR